MNSTRCESLSTAEPLSIAPPSFIVALPPAAIAKVERSPATSVFVMPLRLMKPTSSVSSLVRMPTCSAVSTAPASGSWNAANAVVKAGPSR